MGIAPDDVRVSSGIVTPAQVSTLVDMPEVTVRSWMRPRGNRPPLVHSRTPARRGWPSIPLVGLAEVSSLRALRDSGLSMRTVLDAAAYVRAHWDDPYALANPRLVTDGAEAFLHDTQTDEVYRLRDRQHAFTEILREHLRPLVIGPDDYVQAFHATRLVDADLYLDPRFSAGRLSFSNRVPVFAVLGALAAGELPESVALDFGLKPSEVRAVEQHSRWLADAA